MSISHEHGNQIILDNNGHQISNYGKQRGNSYSTTNHQAGASMITMNGMAIDKMKGISPVSNKTNAPQLKNHLHL